MASDSGFDDAARPLPRRASVAAVLFITLQILLPPVLVLTSDHLPTVFAWQMFSRGTPRVSFEVLQRDGTVVVYSPRDIVVKDRGDIPFARLLPARLCARLDARSITTATANGIFVTRCD